MGKTSREGYTLWTFDVKLVAVSGIDVFGSTSCEARLARDAATAMVAAGTIACRGVGTQRFAVDFQISTLKLGRLGGKSPGISY